MGGGAEIFQPKIHWYLNVRYWGGHPVLLLVLGSDLTLDNNIYSVWVSKCKITSEKHIIL